MRPRLHRRQRDVCCGGRVLGAGAIPDVQGFFGGFLIPLVFSAVFLMFEGSARVRATMVAGIMAMLAPPLGLTEGGFITDRLSWHWLFLINVPPGLIVPGPALRWGAVRHAERAARAIEPLHAPVADALRPELRG